MIYFSENNSAACRNEPRNESDKLVENSLAKEKNVEHFLARAVETNVDALPNLVNAHTFLRGSSFILPLKLTHTN